MGLLFDLGFKDKILHKQSNSWKCKMSDEEKIKTEFSQEITDRQSKNGNE
jgi:hypothetical protein